MNKKKLFTTLTVGLTTATPLVVAGCSCNKGKEDVKDNVVWETKTVSTNEAEYKVTFTYQLKTVSEKDVITVAIKEQSGTKLTLDSQSFDVSTKTGTLVFSLDVKEIYTPLKPCEFSVTITCTGDHTWSEDVTGLKAIYTNASYEVPEDALIVNAEGLITGVNEQTNANLKLCKVLNIPNSITRGEQVLQIKGVGPAAFSGVIASGGALENVESITYDTVPEITTIGAGAFLNCSSLTKPLTIPKSITEVGSYAFKGTNISGLTIENKVDEVDLTIGDSCFESCTSLSGDLVIPNRVKSVGDLAFKNCVGLDGELTIVNNETTLGSGTFQNCIGIESLNLESMASVPADGVWTKTGDKIGSFDCICGSGSITGHEKDLKVLSEDLLSTFKTTLSSCSSVELQFKNEHITSAKHFTYNDDHYITGFSDETLASTTDVLYFPAYYKDDDGYVQEIKGIAESAFYNTSTQVSKIPDTIKSLAFSTTGFIEKIEKQAFYKANFVQQVSVGLTLPETLTEIGESAFELTQWNQTGEYACELTLPSKLVSIGNNAFYMHTNKSLALDATALPETLTTVGDYAFKDCYLLDNEFDAVASLTNVGKEAFAMLIDTESIYDVVLNFKKCYTVPTWTTHTDQNIFGDELSAVSGGTIECIDFEEEYPLVSYNQWDQFEYNNKYQKFFTKIGLDLTKYTFTPSVDTAYLAKNIVLTGTGEERDTITSFAKYGDGTYVESSTMDLLCSDKTINGKTYRSFTIPAIINTGIRLTSIADKALNTDKKQLLANDIVLSFGNGSTISYFGTQIIYGQQQIKALDFTGYSDANLRQIQLAQNAFLISTDQGTRPVYVSSSLSAADVATLQQKFNTSQTGAWQVVKVDA